MTTPLKIQALALSLAIPWQNYDKIQYPECLLPLKYPQLFQIVFLLEALSLSLSTPGSPVLLLTLKRLSSSLSDKRETSSDPPPQKKKKPRHPSRLIKYNPQSPHFVTRFLFTVKKPSLQTGQPQSNHYGNPVEVQKPFKVTARKSTHLWYPSSGNPQIDRLKSRGASIHAPDSSPQKIDLDQLTLEEGGFIAPITKKKRFSPKNKGEKKEKKITTQKQNKPKTMKIKPRTQGGKPEHTPPSDKTKATH